MTASITKRMETPPWVGRLVGPLVTDASLCLKKVYVCMYVLLSHFFHFNMVSSDKGAS